jgi:hypothetical protein
MRDAGAMYLLGHADPTLTMRTSLRVRFEAGHLTREPLDYSPDEGFALVRVERLKRGSVARAVARKPMSAG